MKKFLEQAEEYGAEMLSITVLISMAFSILPIL